MAYSLANDSARSQERTVASSSVRPKTHTPGSPLQKPGLRFYNPGIGRWLSRDPIEEDGGVNLYITCQNNMDDLFDPIGKAWSEDWTDRDYNGGSATFILPPFGPGFSFRYKVALDTTSKDGCCYRASILSTKGGATVYLARNRDRSHEAKHVLHARTIYYEPLDRYLTGTSKSFKSKEDAERWLDRLVDKALDAYIYTYKAYTIWFVDVPDPWQFLLLPFNIFRSYDYQDKAMQAFQELQAIKADP